MSRFIEVKFIVVDSRELTGAALDWAVAAAEGIRCGTLNGEVWRSPHPMCYGSEYEKYTPSSDWSLAGPLIDKYFVELLTYGPVDNRYWSAQNPNTVPALRGNTALIAACRAIVVAKLGEAVSIPVELMK